LALSIAFSHSPFFLKAKRKRISAWLSLSTRILVASHLSIWMVTIMVLVCGNEAMLMSWAENVMGMWDHLVLVIGPSTAT
jgi:hypothetical protein